MNIRILTILTFIIIISSSNAFCQKLSGSVDWQMIINQINEHENNNFELLSHQNRIKLINSASITDLKIDSALYLPLTKTELALVKGASIENYIKATYHIETERKSPYLFYSFIPIRKNINTNQLERISKYWISYKANQLKSTTKSNEYKISESKLSSGNWYKIKISETGIHKLTYEQLVELGIDKPENIRVYGYGGGQLPFMNADTNHDDMVEIPIKMTKDNGTFGQNNYILFYSQGPTTWNYNESIEMFTHEKHDYSKYIYLFLTSDFGAGEKIKIIETTSIANTYSNNIDTYQCIDEDNHNLIRSGRVWFENKIKINTDYNYSFHFSNNIDASPVKIYVNSAGKNWNNAPNAQFTISQDGKAFKTVNISPIYDSYTAATSQKTKFDIIANKGTVNLTFTINGGNSETEGYIDYICLNARENLSLNNVSQLSFRDMKSVSIGNITDFSFSNTTKEFEVWDVTKPTIPFALKMKSNDTFTAATDSLREFIAFEQQNLLTPITQGDGLGLITNQNLHGITPHEMIIVTHPKFISQAEELASLHRNLDNLSVYLTTPEIIYNEFSNGTPDASAIRNFIRYLYNKAETEDEAPKYLLLFGDGSYDNLTYSSSNTNYIPTYQNENGISHTQSFVTDDFYGLLDPDEGGHIGRLDIGIGRLPVQTEEEATMILEKIKHYLSDDSKGGWRNTICFIGDDEDGQLHMRQADEISTKINISEPAYSINKIYLDAYKQVSTPSGQRYPDVTKAINEQVAQGALIIDYVGHGNTRLLAHEEILKTADVRNWKNYDKLAVFVTASCEVGRFDMPNETSIGEWMVLNPNGGGVAALTTTRVVYSGGNHTLNTNFFEHVFNSELRLGDIIRIAKVNTGTTTSINRRNFSLLGDPALKLPIPENEVVITSINNKSVSSNPYKTPFKETFLTQNSESVVDTLNALSTATISGYIADKNGDLIDGDGVIYPTVLDKANTITTYGNDNTTPMVFDLQNNVLYKGKATVSGGFFNFNFIVPKDINYKLGKGKISLFATIDNREAIGYTEDFYIGGSSNEIEVDFNGPEIKLFMNDTTFINGGTTNERPVLLVQLSDESGINTTGNGIGHNITAVINGNYEDTRILNNFYEGYLDKYDCGEIKYPINNLTPGYHTIVVKAWDNQNNSSESEITFKVHSGSEITIENLKNSPNPFNELTYFTFNHNQPELKLDITISIFDIMGTKVTEIKEFATLNGFASNPIEWDGTSLYGQKLPEGVYIYRLDISTPDGKKSSQSSKLMIFK